MKTYLVFVLAILVVVGLNTIAQKFLKQRWILWLGYGIPALGMMLFMWSVSNPPMFFGDFDEAYYPAGRLIIENPSSLYGKDKWGGPGFVNIPIIAILFTPFSFLSLHNIHLLLAVFSGLAIFTACYFIVKLTKSRSKRIALVGLFVINGPLYYSLREGNITHFVVLLLLAGYFCIHSKRNIWLGIILAIAALLKIPLLLLGIYYLLRRRWHVVAGFSTTLLIIVGASLLLFGLDLHVNWFEQCIQPYMGKPMIAYNVQSLDSFLARLLIGGNLNDYLPIDVDWGFKIIRYVLLSLLVGTTIWVCWRSKPPTTLEAENLEFSIVLCLALLISPISWTHYYLFLILPFALYFSNLLAVPKRRLWTVSVTLSILLTSLPVIYSEPPNPVLGFLYSRLFISHYFLGGVLFLGVLLAARWHSKSSGLPQIS